MREIYILATALTSLGLSVPLEAAQAAILTFTGNATATTGPGGGPDPTCAPLRFRGIVPAANSSGTSNLGAFTYAHNLCTEGAVTPVSLQDGTFAIDFGYGAISGRLTGETRPRSGTPGLSDQVFAYTILGGTGGFAGATGAFTNIGILDTRNAPPSRFTFNFSGLINAPVPEPGTWALMIAGFAMAGAAMRRRNSRVSLALCLAKS